MDERQPRTRDSGTLIRPTPASVLFIEDDETSARLTENYLIQQGFSVTSVRTAAAAIAELGKKSFDMVLLDLILPGGDGLELCGTIRQRSDVPIIIISALTEEDDRLSGFDAGADDYMVKPFSPRELVSRMIVMIRRARGQVGPVKRTLVVGDLALEPSSLKATRGGRPLGLTSYEFLLLYALAERRGKVVTREQLLEAAGGSADQAFDRSVDVHMSRIRNKLGDDARNPALIKTVRGAGYMLAVTSEAADG
ncbi:MAG: response regulator transcription factor [Deltaproteobacteria bacterium]|nr:response regulator transcription factor [Deltaproteobacteria bacterium]